MGIQDIRNIDATKVRKVKNIKYKKDDTTGAKVVDKVEEFYIFQEKGGSNSGIKLSPDSVSYVTSGLLDLLLKNKYYRTYKALKTYKPFQNDGRLTSNLPSCKMLQREEYSILTLVICLVVNQKHI